MLDAHLASPITRQRLRSDPVGHYIDGFADWLHQRGYEALTIKRLLGSLAGLNEWFCAAGYSVTEFRVGLAACKVEFENRPEIRGYRGVTSRSLTAASIFIRYLQELGVIRPAEVRLSPADRWSIIGEFRSWTLNHRGLTITTLDVYEFIIAELVELLGDAPETYTAGALRDFVLERAGRHGAARARSVVGAVRAFLRFLAATGQCPSGMAHAIPGFASWQLSSIPRFLPNEDVERVITSCGEDRVGVRDRAVLLFLARLGLRAGEVAQLKFRDIDWDNGLITVCGKGRREERLPLPQDVGSATLRYLQYHRPRWHADEVFITAQAPIRSLTRWAVTCIVRRALARAGVKAPSNGAHVLRHSAATTMLRQGVSLAGIGAVLRHRSPRTTAHYAKVSFGLLSEIAQPWPEV
jgi:integrase/recombinase XerD